MSKQYLMDVLQALAGNDEAKATAALASYVESKASSMMKEDHSTTSKPQGKPVK